LGILFDSGESQKGGRFPDSIRENIPFLIYHTTNKFGLQILCHLFLKNKKFFIIGVFRGKIRKNSDHGLRQNGKVSPNGDKTEAGGWYDCRQMETGIREESKRAGGIIKKFGEGVKNGVNFLKNQKVGIVFADNKKFGCLQGKEEKE